MDSSLAPRSLGKVVYLFLMSLSTAESVFINKSSSLRTRSQLNSAAFGPHTATTILFPNDSDVFEGRNPNVRNQSILVLVYMPDFACFIDTKCAAVRRQIVHRMSDPSTCN